VSFNETNPHISKIIEEADISGSGDSGKIDPTSNISDPTSRNSTPTNLLINRNLRLQIIIDLQIYPIQN